MHPSWWWPFSGGLVARPDDPLEPDPYHDQVWALPTQLIDQRNGAVQFIAKLFEPLLRYDHYVPGGHVPAYQNWPTEAVRGGVLHHSRRPGGLAENRTRVRELSAQSSFTCVDAVSPATESMDSATAYFPCDPRSPTRNFSVSQPL